ncbi:YqzH family protein [Bacillus sp. FJAT-27245]|uniref:YqzH family protein n=1 Tax=Bacillus sp. FJAT-27245 TaxID=1684144 RepID=UPI0006A7CF8E|nr:YqzH family protein [Bacillus sp. FJAT-27245]
MDEKLVKKMIKNCLKQYYGSESQPLGERDVNDICERVYRLKEAEAEADMRDIVNDVVYEFLTG